MGKGMFWGVFHPVGLNGIDAVGWAAGSDWTRLQWALRR